jgi:hypothetical protein
MVLDIVLPALINLNFFILIIGGLLAAAWLLTRLAGVSTDADISEIVSKIAIIGFPVGIASFITIGAAFYLISREFMFPDTFDFVTLICLLILGLVLILRPIKDFKFGTFISLAIGLLGAGILVFLGEKSVKLLSIIFILLFIVIYITIKFFEDLYLLIAEILSSPIISVSIGVLCVIQGLLEIIGFSLAGIFTFFFP